MTAQLPRARPRRRRFARLTKAAFWALIMGVLAWVAWSGIETRQDLRLATQRAIRVAELRGSFAYLNEWMTMSARMAVATGDQRWVERYDEASPKLAANIAEALTQATPEIADALENTTQEAYRGLASMQRAAMDGAERSGLQAAQALLNGPEFAYLEAVYQSGIDAFGEDLTELTRARAADLDRRAWLEAASLILGIVLVTGAVFARRGNARLSVAMKRTEFLARTDPLTGLPNRRKFYEDLQAMTSGAAVEPGAFALLMLDLDRFKTVNDAHGHAAGDALLHGAAERLAAVARAGDVVARLGADEFAIIAPLAATPLRTETEAAAQAAARIIEAFAAPFDLTDGLSVQVGASIGIAIHAPGDGVAEDLVYRADVALGRAKAEGRNRPCFFEPQVDEQVRARAKLEAELRQALQDGALVPYFQPLVETQTGRIVAFEMLARWPRPGAGMISPGDFIPLAESAGLIADLTRRLITQACRAAAQWPSHITLACNVSPLLLKDSGFVATLRTILDETGFAPARLELEITESALLDDLAFAGALMRDMKQLGVSLALDDFGTGYSSLRHLQSLPFDKLKIDAGFVGGMAGDGESRKIVSAVIGLGQSLGLVTVAEGVETEDVAALLRDLGCDLGQGWLFGRPASEHATATLLRQTVRAGIQAVA